MSDHAGHIGRGEWVVPGHFPLLISPSIRIGDQQLWKSDMVYLKYGGSISRNLEGYKNNAVYFKHRRVYLKEACSTL